MLLRTFLLLLCVSSSLCATLGLFHMQAKDEDTPPQDAALDNAVEVVIENLEEKDADDIPKETPQHEEEKTLDNGNDKQPEDDIGVQSVTVEDAAPAEEVVKVQAVTVEDAAPKEEVVKVQAVTVEDAEEVVETDSDKTADKTLEENVVASQEQEQLPQEEDNEIKPIQTKEVPKPVEQSRWGLNSIRSGFQNINGYFDSLVELVGGRNGVCQYRCRYGQIPAHRPGYQLPEPNGCSSSLVGFQLDLGIPAMTQCCNQLDSCYDSCGTSKYDCDSSFRTCLHSICSDLKKSLGLGTQYQACESMADGLFNTVWTLGCRPYMNSQRAACICEEEERDEL